MWFKQRKEYSEAYLEIKKDKVLQKEKTRREELGDETPRQESAETYTPSVPAESNSREAPQEAPVQKKTTPDADVPYEEEEDAREIPKPRKKSAWFILIFWLLFIVSAFPFFKPFVQDVLNTPVDYTMPEKLTSKETETATKDTTEVPADKTEAPLEVPETNKTPTLVDQVTERIQDTAPDVIEGAQTIISQAQEDLTQDDLRIYARVHRIISDNAQQLRDTTQRYVTRQGHYVEMIAFEGRIQTEMSRARQLLNSTETTSLHANLLGRIERTEAIKEEIKDWDRTLAADAINAFVRNENEDSEVFIGALKEALDDAGRSYSLDDNNAFSFD